MKIDMWTLGIQAVNVLILVLLLRRFFWRPVADMIARRQTEVQAVLDDATAKRSLADKALADIEATRAGFAAEREAILAEARTEAEKARSAALDAARLEAETVKKAAAAALAHDESTAGEARADQAASLAVDIARRLAGRLDGPAVHAVFAGWLVAEITALPTEAKQAVAGNDGAALELVSATPLEPEVQSGLVSQIAAALGTEPQITFSIDPALIAGFELHSPYFTLRNSWQADLARVSESLRHDA